MNRINNGINNIKYKISYVNEKQSIPSILLECVCIIEYMKNSLGFIVGPMRHSQRFSFAKPLAVSHWPNNKSQATFHIFYYTYTL